MELLVAELRELDRHALPVVSKWELDRVRIEPRQAYQRTRARPWPGPGVLRCLPDERPRPLGGKGDQERV
jgi:hypothetical protein